MSYHMRNYMNSNLACTGHIDKYIGSAFDIVKAVADNLDNLKPLFENLGSNELNELIALAPEMQDLLKQLVFFRDTYYGPLSVDPVKRPSGGAPQPGDLYYNTDRQVLMVYEAGEWVPTTGVDNKVEAITVTGKHINGSDAVFDLHNKYNPGTGNLLVFVNGTFQYPITASDSTGAYIETDPNTVTFPGGQLQEGDLVTFLVGKPVTNVAQTVGVQMGYYRTLVNGEKVITLPGSMYYDPGLNNLEVYVDGILKIPNVDYTETDKNTISFTKALPTGSLVLFKKGSVIATGTPGGTGQPSQVQVLSTVGEFYNTGINTNQIIVLRGYYQVGDGGFGLFVYDPLRARSDANAGTVIDSTRPLDQQGTGVGNGAWVRQYSGRIYAEWFGLQELLMEHLVGMTKPQQGDLAELVGYHEAGDGGEGIFYWDAAQPVTEHDGGVVVDPLQPFPANWNNAVQMSAWFTPRNAGTGAWVRLNKEQASITWFGAKGDNTTDNSLVFEGIADAVQRGDVRELLIPAGEFVLSGTGHFEIDGLTSNFKLYGEGESSVVRCKTGTAQMPIIFRNSQGIEVNAVRFTDERRTAGNNGLTLMNCSDVLVHRCYFDGISNYAIAITEDTIGNTSTQCNNIRIENNQFVHCGPNNGGAILHAPKALSQNVTIDNNYMTYCGGPTSAAIEAGMGTFGATITNNYLDASLGNAIKITAYENITVSNNKIEDFGLSGIFVHAGTSPQYNAPTLTNCQIVRNDISFINPTNPQGDYGVKIEGNIDALGLLLVSDNSFYECAGISIEPQAVLRNIVITANKVQNIPVNLFGLFVGNQKGGGAENLYVAENYIENEEAAKNAVMVSLTNAPDVLFERNHIKRSGTTDILLNNCNDAHIIANTFFEPNLTNTGAIPVIQISDARAVDYTIARNIVIRGRRGTFNAWTNIAAAPPTVHESDNIDIR